MAETSDKSPGPLLKLTVVTYERKVIEVECDEVVLPGTWGEFGILPGHIPMVASLKFGELSYRIGRRFSFLAVSSGFCEVQDDEVTVLVEFVELPEEIDVARAEKEAADADADVRAATDQTFIQALARLEAATVRIQVGQRAS